MSLRHLTRWMVWPACLAITLTSLAWSQQTAQPETAKPADEKAQATDAADDKEDKPDPFAVPDGSNEELIDFIKKMQRRQPEATTQEEFLQEVKQILGALLEASNRVLKSEDPSDEHYMHAASIKLLALGQMARFGDLKAQPQAKKYAQTLITNKRPQIVELGYQFLFMDEAEDLPRMPKAGQQDFLNRLLKFVAENPNRTRVSLALQVIRDGLERYGHNKLAAASYKTLAKTMRASGNPELAEVLPRIEGTARRLDLPGNFMALSGETAAGEKFDWKSYRGKVVLVDFWATWCGPCIAELPNVKRNYELYHERGFDVVGINLDNSRESMMSFVKEKDIPWVNLFSSDPETQGWEHPMVTYYGVSGIPTAILVDKDGKVVSLSARGGELTGLLETLIGPAEVEKTETANENPGSK